MKNLFSLLFLLSISNCFSQPKVLFDYDNAGNQVKRYLIDVTAGKQSIPPIRNLAEIPDAELIKADIYDDLRYYPNPVKEELYLKWELLKDNKVLSMSLYSLSGQLVRTAKNLEGANTYIFPFSDLPQAIYNLVLNYSSGDQKSLKIIKR